MTYDVQIGITIRRGLSYAELVTLQIKAETFVRRENSDWIQAKDCVELSHVLANNATNQDNTTSYEPICVAPIYRELQSFNDNVNDEYEEEDYDYDVDEEDVDNHDSQPFHYAPINIYESSPSYESEEERIFIPTAEYFKCKQKRKSAIIGVVTLGLAGLALMGVGNTWRSNIFEGLSFTKHEGMDFVFKCLSFLILTTFVAVPYFIYSVFALIYYSIRLNSLKR